MLLSLLNVSIPLSLLPPSLPKSIKNIIYKISQGVDASKMAEQEAPALLPQTSYTRINYLCEKSKN